MMSDDCLPHKHPKTANQGMNLSSDFKEPFVSFFPVFLQVGLSPVTVPSDVFEVLNMRLSIHRRALMKKTSVTIS